MLQPTHLHTFLVVMKRGSFAGAARQLGYTSSAVSQQIAALEKESGLTLFVRRAHGIEPASSARDLFEHAQAVVASHSALDARIRSLREGLSGSVAVGTFPSASRQLLPLALAELGDEHPEIEVRLDEGEPDQLENALVERELDAALVYRYDLAPRAWPHGLEVVPLLIERLTLLVPPGHRFTDCDVRFADLADEVWISTRESTSGAQALRHAAAAAGFSPDVRHRSNDYEVVRGLVRSGLGIALVPALAADGMTDVPSATIHDLDVRRHVLLVTTPEPITPSLATVLTALIRAVDDAAGRVLGAAVAAGAKNLRASLQDH